MRNFIELLALAVLVFVAGATLRMYKQHILGMVTDLVNRAENAIHGSGLGAEKKAIVLAQLEAAGVQVTAWLSNQIDLIVASLNASGAWLASQAKQAAAGMGARNLAAEKSGDGNA